MNEFKTGKKIYTLLSVTEYLSQKTNKTYHNCVIYDTDTGDTLNCLLSESDYNQLVKLDKLSDVNGIVVINARYNTYRFELIEVLK